MADEKERPWVVALRLDVGINRLTGQLYQLEPDWLASLLLSHGGAIDGVTVWSDILDFEGDNVTTT